MRKFYLFVILSCSVMLNLSAQGISETIEYINDKLLKFEFDEFDVFNNRDLLALVSMEDRSLAEDMELFKYYYQWEIKSDGLLAIHRYRDVWVIEEGTKYPDWKYDEPKLVAKKEERGYSTVYLKEIDTVVSFNVRTSSQGEKFWWEIEINCKQGLCFTDAESGSKSNFRIRIYDRVQAKKLQNAIGHLLVLAQTNPNYRESDPFED